jgi:hypothetical protein
MRFPFALISCAVLLGTSAQLYAVDHGGIAKIIYQPCYLRIYVPTNYEVQPFLEVSPTGASWDRLVGRAGKKAKNHQPSGVYFAFRPNDTIK